MFFNTKADLVHCCTANPRSSSGIPFCYKFLSLKYNLFLTRNYVTMRHWAVQKQMEHDNYVTDVWPGITHTIIKLATQRNIILSYFRDLTVWKFPFCLLLDVFFLLVQCPFQPSWLTLLFSKPNPFTVNCSFSEMNGFTDIRTCHTFNPFALFPFKAFLFLFF